MGPMSDTVQQLFAAFMAEHRSGGSADPRVYLDRLTDDLEREELTALIDEYLARAPRRRWDAAGFAASSRTVGAVDALQRSLDGESGQWPALLPRLRRRAGITRGRLTERLAAALGVMGREEKVAAYYHAMEQGRLPAAGVSDRVLEALAGIVGASASALRDAGAAVAPPASNTAPSRAAFARRAAAPEGARPPAAAEATEPRDEVDDLFRGG
jgi:hypothetical protein